MKAIIAWGVDPIPEDIAKDSRIFTFKGFMEAGKTIADEVVVNTMQK